MEDAELWPTRSSSGRGKAMKRLTAFIFARGGSKGLPGKNTRLLAGKPLIGWAVEQALAVPAIDRVIVSTDTSEIAAAAQAYGAQVPFVRPARLALDTTPELEAWCHALNYLRKTENRLPEAFVSVPATAPLRKPADISACIDLFAQGGSDVVLTITHARSNPWFNMVAYAQDGTIAPVNNPEGTVMRRQDAPHVMDISTVAYVADPKFVLAGNRIFSGRVRGVVRPPEHAIDIDTALDFEIADFLMHKRLEAL